MIRLPAAETVPASVIAELSAIGDGLKATSPADAVACAFGVGLEVVAWHDDTDGKYFDLASLTKPLFTAPTVLGLIAGRDDLEESVDAELDWVPHLAGTPTLGRLLTHAAGLPDEFAPEVDASTVHGWLADRVGGLAADPGFVSYSDPSYWMLGQWASARSGESLHALFERAPTAASGGFRFGGAPAESTVPAGPVEHGVQLTHDPAARRLGESGHADAFGTLTAVVDAVVTWLEPAWLPQDLAAAAVTCQTHATPGGHRGLAWTLAGDPFHVVAHDWPATTVCHTGFTGVSVALDPVSRWWAVYLSNAIPVGKDALPILRARRLFHAVAARRLRARVAVPSHT